MEKHKAKDLQASDIGDFDPDCFAIEVVAHVFLEKHRASGLVYVAGNVPVGVLGPELALLSTDKSLTSRED